MGTAAEVVASDILVGGQPRIRRWARARSSGSELVDTATAQRQQREEDAARGTAVPPERRGRGATSVAMKWRDAVEGGHHARASATGCHSRCDVLVATWNATVTTGGQHGASAAEAQTRHVC